MPAPIEDGDFWERFGKGLRGFALVKGESLVSREERIFFEKNQQRLNFYGCLQPNAPVSSQNLNFASIPHPSETVRSHVQSVHDRLMNNSLSREEREALWQEAREKACQLINHPDPRGVLLTGNTTQALGFFHWLSGMLHGKNRVSLLQQVLTTDVENGATYRAVGTLGEDGNPFGRDALTTYPTWRASPVKETERRCSLSTFYRMNTRGKTLEDMKQQLEKLIKPTLTLTTVPDSLVLSHVDRETGRELPVKELIAHARMLKTKADPKHPHLYCVVDGAQALGNVPRVDWEDLDADMYVMSPHKTMGSERLGIAFFNPDNPLTVDGMKLLRYPGLQDYIAIYDGNFHPDLGISSNNPGDPYFKSMGIEGMEINTMEVAAFSKAVDELTELRYLKGNDFSGLDQSRRGMKAYCQTALEEVSRRLGGMITIPPVDHPTNFILSFRVGPEQKPIRQLPILQRMMPTTWRPKDPEDFGHEIGRRLNELGVALTYFSEPNLFRVSFDRETTRQGINQFISSLERVLREIPELNPDRVL